jgi:uncharacterized protein YfkK (UPF0435 family)
LSHTVYNKSYVFENRQYSKEDYENLTDIFFSLNEKEKNIKIEKWKKEYK